jgi:hypothetical protein
VEITYVRAGKAETVRAYHVMPPRAFFAMNAWYAPPATVRASSSPDREKRFIFHQA